MLYVSGGENTFHVISMALSGNISIFNTSVNNSYQSNKELNNVIN